MVRKLIERACGVWDDRMLAAAATTLLLLVGGIASLLLLSLAAFKGVLWLSGIRWRVEHPDTVLNW